MTTALRESDILKTIMDGLAAKKIWRKRMNSGKIISSYKGKNRAITFGEPGMADILVSFVYGGKTQILWIECKNDKGQQTQEQRDFEKEVYAQGHDYLLARSWDAVQSYFEAWGR